MASDIDLLRGKVSHGAFVYSAPINMECSKCAGTCLNENDNAATQAAALKMFGYIPNKCVSDSTGRSKCPYAQANNHDLCRIAIK